MKQILLIDRKQSFNIYQYPVPKIATVEQKSHIVEKLELDDYTDVFTIFVSIPYCSKQCNSCSFYKNLLNISNNKEMLNKYIEIVSKQAQAYASTNRFKSAVCKAIYFGGGTASLLSPIQLIKILTSIVSTFHLDPEVEITFEANPYHLTREYLKEIESSSINRISIGLQSLNEKVLRVINTMHNEKHGIRSIQNVIHYKYSNFNVDLLFGVPTQTENDFFIDLQKVIEYNPASISLNRYKIFPGSRMAQMIFQGHIQQTDEFIKDRMLEKSREILLKAGYYEDSLGSFSTHKFEKQYKKYTYQLGKESIGLGAGAYGFINGFLMKTGNNVYKYINDIENGHFLSCESLSNQATKKTRMQKYLMHNLLSGEINVHVFRSIFAENIFDCFGEAFSNLAKAGLVHISENQINVTDIAKNNIYAVLSCFFEK